jgi:isocitrate dehydrogenase (NAD+)
MFNITLIKGDGIGPEVSMATKKIIDATGVKINWDIVNAGQNIFEATGNLIPEDVYASLERNKIALKGPITTPIGTGFRSINVHLRKKYNLYANIRPIQSMKNTKSRYKDVDFTIFRENTEGLYIGIENKISKTEVEAIKKVTTLGSERIIRKAFDYAKNHKIDTVTVAHKANILKQADGLFLNIARRIAKEYPMINLSEVIIDNLCMQLVMNPEQYKIIVTMNLYGDIISDLGAGLIGGLGLVPGGNIGEDIAIFEAVHGSAPDIAGQNIANPTALLKSGIMMLKYIGEQDSAEKIEKALKKIYSEGKILTRDLGGTATTTEFTQAIIDAL